ncbi:putative lipid II flippase FtsW [Hahella sp. SMD15-11]|uniref:Probable peptidoglycan glycosyltransferase FtsW n=1 Tax=Thermohahella caldifontis TaxID=3142973 RepID=A0AB39UWS0_9GAMM
MNRAAVIPHADLYFAIDRSLLMAALALAIMGLVMVASASVEIAQSLTGNALYFAFRQALYLAMALALGFAMLRIPMDFWRKQDWLLLGLTLALLVAVLIPGIGRTVNGSSRWLSLGLFNLQASEVAKIATVFYTASYLVRREQEVRTSLWGFVKPLLVVCVFAVLLLMEPDLGALVVILTAVTGVLFIAGVRWLHFGALVLTGAAGVAILAITSPYRLKRLTAYLDPWADQFDTGYQLVQALIAFGRGELAGVGLGNSIQKLSFLPEAHTDFVFAIIGEELGLMGSLIIIALFAIVAWRGLYIAMEAQRAGQAYQAYVAYGITFVLTFQAVVNLGVNTGLLPTKGLTLPFVSYGGSSLLMSGACIGILLRCHAEAVRAREAAT